MRLSTLGAHLAITLTFLSFSVASSASAGIIYDNISQPIGGVAAASFTNANGPLYDSFSTGDAPESLTDVQLLLAASNPGDGFSSMIILAADNGTSPGAFVDLLGMIPDSSLTAASSVVDLPQTGGPLVADTRYWIGVIASDSTVEWAFDAVNGGTGVANEFNYYDGMVQANSVFTPYQMQVSAVSPVAPEPGSLSLMIVFGMGAAVRFARRRR